ncbi:MAG TPA: hypothetical protein VLR26_01895 [Frankiaceae bacterium]|nr:hypothetical protein [Frankiaceae bacterium]
MTVTRDTAQRWSATRSRVEVEVLLTGLRSGAFDLRRNAFVGYLLELRSDREGAYAVRARVAADGWQVALFVDTSGWVVRLGRVELVRPNQLDRERRYVQDLARTYGASVRGVCIENLQREDVWDRLAARTTARTTARTGQSLEARESVEAGGSLEVLPTRPAVVSRGRVAHSLEPARREPACSA